MAVEVRRPPLGKDWFRLATGTQVMLGLCVITWVGVIAADRFIASVGRQFADAPRQVDLSDAERSDTLILVSTFGPLDMLLLTGMLFITWLYQAHRSDRVEPAYLERSSGWAIGGWFVPVLNLWRPYQMVTDIRRGVRGPLSLGTGTQVVWWVLWVASSISDRVTARMWPDDPDLGPREYGEKLASAADAEVMSSVLVIASAVLAILVVRQITKLVAASEHGVRADAQTSLRPS